MQEITLERASGSLASICILAHALLSETRVAGAHGGDAPGLHAGTGTGAHGDGTGTSRGLLGRSPVKQNLFQTIPLHGAGGNKASAVELPGMSRTMPCKWLRTCNPAG
jgi:hypothetical protein